MKYFEDEVRDGNWDKVEMHLSSLMNLDVNKHSMRMFFIIKEQKYLETLDK